VYQGRVVGLLVRGTEGESSGIPHLAKNERDTRISSTRYQATATCAAFIEESRMKFINANKLLRKSGGLGTRPLGVGYRVEEGIRGSSAGRCARYDTLGRLLLRYTRFHHGA
jgi:hypothetical protein